MNLEPFRDTQPAFDLTEYFQGKTWAHGVFQGRSGAVKRNSGSRSTATERMTSLSSTRPSSTRTARLTSVPDAGRLPDHLFGLECHPTLPVAATDFARERSLADTALVLQGSGTASYLVWNVCDAVLYASAGAIEATIEAAEVPMSLVLAYHRQVDIEDIRKATWAALDRQVDAAGRAAIRPKIDAIQKAMVDIGEGDRYRLNWQPEARRLVLYLNGEPRFESDDADLTRAYFGIWLAKPLLSNKLRQALLSQRD